MVRTRLIKLGSGVYISFTGAPPAKENLTMDKSPLASNPFAMLIHPNDVIQAMQRSDRLGRLQSRICRPLDKPLIARSPDEMSAFDLELDDRAEPAQN